MLIKNLILLFIGLAGGGVVSAGVFAFITMIGIFPRFADRTHTASYIYLYEQMVIWGGIIGNLVVIFGIHLPIGLIGLTFLGFFSGIYVGCLAIALAEVLNVFPIFVKRANLVCGLSWMVLALALGKCAGSFFQLCMK